MSVIKTAVDDFSSVFKRIFKTAPKVAEAGKSEIKAAATVAQAGKAVVKTADSSLIKTTSTLTTIASPTSGGRAIAKTAVADFAKGAGTTAKVGGKVFGATAILGGTSLAGGAIYNYLADTAAKTTAQREYDLQIKLAGKEADVIKEAQQNQIDYITKIQELQGSGASAGMGASGGASTLFPLQERAAQASEAEASASGTMWTAIIVLGLLGAGVYVASKTVFKKKKV